MRLATIAGLLFTIGSVVAQDQDIDLTSLLSQLGNPSEACSTEAQKYQSCVTGKSSMIKEGKKEEIEAFCKSFDESKCKDFFNDINKTESACLNVKETNLADVVADLDFIAAKLQYQAYCVKGKDGNLCPVSKYIVENADKLENNQQTELTADQLKIIADDCKDDNCQARMISLKETSDTVKTIIANIGGSASQMASSMAGSFLSSNSTIALVDKFYTNYKEKKCSAIDNSKDEGSKSNNSSDASTLKKITYTFVTMVALSAVMLL